MEQPERSSLKRSFEAMDGGKKETDPMEIQPLQAHEVKVVKAALMRNTIAVVGPGTDRTMLALLMVQEFVKSLMEINVGKKIVVLATTVNLVHQLYETIKCHTKLQVQRFFGARGIDNWDAIQWGKEVNDHDVLVMTPQILLNGLEKEFLGMGRICLMVMDDCYCASGSHPYAKTMKEFYHRCSKKPKIFGMAVSDKSRKGTSTIEEVENLLDSQILTIANSEESEDHLSSTNECCKFYDPPHTPNSEMKIKLDSSWSKFDAVLLKLQVLWLLSPSHSIDSSSKYEKLRKKLSDDHASIAHCLHNLGAIPALEAAKVCLENILNDREECECRDGSSQCRYFLEEVISILDESLQLDCEKPPASGFDPCVSFTKGYITPKLYLLFEILKSFGPDQVPCVVYVESIITAKVVERLAKTITLGSFCSKVVDIIFTTDAVMADAVMEETNAPKCSSVIRFDLPTSVSSYAHSRKQACRKDLKYITMLERGNIEQKDQMFRLICNECFVVDTVEIKEDCDSVPIKCGMKQSDIYCVEATGASVGVDSSISLINRYCQKLGDKNATPKPEFETIVSPEQLYRCRLTLPPDAAFQTIIGPDSLSARVAKKLACLEACKKLHELGALNDYLLPTGTKPTPQKISDPPCQVATSAAGTTKRKELHGTASISALAGMWGEVEEAEVEFQAYRMDFCSNDPKVNYSSFVLLMESKLDDDVGNIEVELYLLKRNVKAFISSIGQISLDANQVTKAKQFQEFFFNGLFGKLFTRASGERKLILDMDRSLWEKSYMYLLLPIVTLDSSPEPLCIDWNGIQSTVSAVEFLKRNAWYSAELSEANRRNCFMHRNDFDATEQIQMANKAVHRSSVRGMVVIAIHSGRIYSVLESVTNSSSRSPFEGSTDETPSIYSSYEDYFQKRYRIILSFPEQSMFLLKQSHNAHNLLEDFRNTGLSLRKESKHGGKMPNIKPQQHVHIPPELLISIDIRLDVLRSFYLLPSLMHRLQSLMLASQLRREICCHYGDSHVPSSLILEALTTQRCNESMSMERLELLGDSVLKYALSCHLFLKYPDIDEGSLTDKRRWGICNATLHKLGISRNIQGYILNHPFIPRTWAAPGQLSIWPSPCKHGVDTLEVPVNNDFSRDDEQVEFGQCCDKGHRWIVSKTISDCVEALIGAYYVGGGLSSSLKLMKWIGVDIDLDNLPMVNDALKAASLHSYTPTSTAIDSLESKLGYIFSVKGLLLEAITHKTKQGLGINCCYERLEFLGDAVLDILITRYLYQNHTDFDPGELTDLRSASVNNTNFALAAVRANLHPHLQHCSTSLEFQILEFEQTISSSSCTAELLVGGKAPKELGDLVESIAGAILIDTRLDLDKVWKIFEPILSPIVTPESLELPPYRELIELCSSSGYFLNVDWKSNGEAAHAELKVQLEDALVVAEGLGLCRKDAKGKAALCLLKDLKSRGVSSKKNRPETADAVTVPLAAAAPLLTTNGNDNPCKSNTSLRVIPPINMKKGGPRSSLFSLCKSLQWPMPTIDATESKSTSLIEFGKGSEKRTGFSSFKSRITLTIPNSGVVEVSGEKQPDKKSSADSAALSMLLELERQGKILIRKERSNL
ncbi:unnamed protein product [Cuscuta campestris]|uniref:Uncharacterized protein n=1 Tax=Cuscuta campestris TaxID=132261 RepID=A0A484KR72_9ASTE|nr:unnamed protein product [Cuscuta campestris]